MVKMMSALTGVIMTGYSIVWCDEDDCIEFIGGDVPYTQ